MASRCHPEDSLNFELNGDLVVFEHRRHQDTGNRCSVRAGAPAGTHSVDYSAPKPVDSCLFHLVDPVTNTALVPSSDSIAMIVPRTDRTCSECFDMVPQSRSICSSDYSVISGVDPPPCLSHFGRCRVYRCCFRFSVVDCIVSVDLADLDCCCIGLGI